MVCSKSELVILKQERLRKRHQKVGSWKIFRPFLFWNDFSFLAELKTAQFTSKIFWPLKNGAKVDAKNDDGWTPLILAARFGHATIVKNLIENGADVNATTNFGETALFKAVDNGHVNVVEELIKNAANFNETVPDFVKTVYQEQGNLSRGNDIWSGVA